MKRPIFPSLLVAAISAASLLVACGGGGGYSAPANPYLPPTPSPTVPQSASTIVPLSDAGAPIVLPDLNGGYTAFAESITLPSNNAPAGTNALISLSTTTLPKGVPSLSILFPVLYLSLTSPVTVTFKGLSAFSVTSLSGLGMGTEYGVAYYDPTVGAWNDLGSGEITESDTETTVTFSGTSASVMLKAGVTYSLGLYTKCPYCY